MFTKVSSSTDVTKLAGFIAARMKEDIEVELAGIGVVPVNIILKSIAIARGYTAPMGIDIRCTPYFNTLKTRNGDISQIIFKCFKK